VKTEPVAVAVHVWCCTWTSPTHFTTSAKLQYHSSVFTPKTGFWPSYCQISTDLDKNLHTIIVVRNPT